MRPPEPTPQTGNESTPPRAPATRPASPGPSPARPTTPPRRIVVLGSPGSGKTTFCHALAAAGGPPLYHLDDLYWRQGWRRPSPDEWSATVEAVTALPRWIVDGNFLDTVPVRVRAADLVVLLDRHPALCAWALLRRSLRLRRDASGGRQRRDHTPAGLTAADPPVRSVTALLRKALFFRRRELRAMAPLLAGCKARVVRCRTRSRTDRLLRQLTADPAPAPRSAPGPGPAAPGSGADRPAAVLTPCACPGGVRPWAAARRTARDSAHEGEHMHRTAAPPPFAAGPSRTAAPGGTGRAAGA